MPSFSAMLPQRNVETYFPSPYLFSRPILGVKCLHFYIQTTGQRSYCVNTGLRPSHYFVLIKQSDSLGPYQFQFSRSTQTKAGRGPTDPTLGSNPFVEVMDLISGLPLPTQFRRRVANHLWGLLLRSTPQDTAWTALLTEPPTHLRGYRIGRRSANLRAKARKYY